MVIIIAAVARGYFFFEVSLVVPKKLLEQNGN